MEFVLTTGKRFWQSTRFITDTSSRNSQLHDSKCHRCDSSAGKYRATCREIGSTTTMPMSERRPSTMNSFLPAEVPQNSMADQQRLQISELHFEKNPHTFNVFMLEGKIQKPSRFLFRFSLGGNVIDQRSGDGRVGGRSKVIARNLRVYSFPKILDAGCEDGVRSEQDHAEFLLPEKGPSVWKNRKLRKRIGSFAEDRSHT